MVTQYTIPCSYRIPKLRDNVYFISKSVMKVINIDNGAADVTINNPNVIRLKGFDIRFNETESLDERYKFTKTLNISILGHLTNSSFLMNDDYFLAVEDYNGMYYLINVDFPSKMTYTYTLNEGQNQTEFTFTSNSNFPLLKLNWNISKFTDCDTYFTSGIKSISLIEKGWARVDVAQDVITLFDGHTFKNVDFNEGSCTLTESYDGEKITNTISFDIPLGNTQSSWQYNLLEFKQNLYIAEIFPKSSSNALIIGYETGLQPSYNVTGSTSNGDSSKITITLEETSQRGLEELINWSVVENTNKKWVYVKEINHKNAFTCVGHGLARYDYMAEVDQDGNEIGNYKRFSGATEENFPYLNVVGTFDDEVTFQSSVCNCSDDYTYKFLGHYYCVNGDKVEALENVHTYDCGKSGTINGTSSPLSDYTEIGNVVEESSDFCEDEVEYMWVLKTDKSECVTNTSRWVDSGYTCSGITGYDKYLVQKEQIWDDELGWVDTDPLITAATLVEKDSEDCGYVPTPKVTLNKNSGYTLYCNDSTELTRDEVFSLGLSPTAITYATFGTCVRSIGNRAFSGCSNLGHDDTLVLPEGLESVGIAAFYMCYSQFYGGLPSTLTGISTTAFAYCDWRSVTIPSGVTSIGIHAFSNNARLANLTIGSGARTIEDGAFMDCYISAVTIPDNVTTIGYQAFRNSSLSSRIIDIGTGCTSINGQAFMCYSIRSVTVRSTVPPSLGEGAFWVTVGDNFLIYVPAESVEAYKAASGWSDYAERIRAIGT